MLLTENFKFELYIWVKNLKDTLNLQKRSNC